MRKALTPALILSVASPVLTPATAQDLNGFGHWRAFLMHLFSSGVKVSGADVRVMMECCEIHYHQTSPARLRSHTLLFYTQGFMLSSLFKRCPSFS